MSSGNKGTVGVIGLGIMGSAIAANLVKAGFEVIGTDLLREARSALKKAGGRPVASSGEVGKACRRIIVSIASEAALYQVCDQLAASCANGTIVMETGTLPLAAKQKVRSLLARRYSARLHAVRHRRARQSQGPDGVRQRRHRRH